MKTSLPVYEISVPSPVRFDTRLSAAAKLLYGEIAYLCQEHGYCSLDYHYFAGLYGVTTKTVTAWVAQLEGTGYLQIRYDASGQQRLLYLEAAIEENHVINQISLNL